MPQMLTLPTNELEKIELRLANLETLLSRLIAVVEYEKEEQPNAFDKLFNSRAFENYAQQTVKELHADGSQFVNLFETYRAQK